MKKLIFFLVMLIPFSGFSTTVEDILQQPVTYDNKTVTVVGEVVGESLLDKDGVWINITSGGFALGVFFEEKTAIAPIVHMGSYKQTGDVVRIEGTFYAVCPRHAHQDIHARELEVVEIGGPSREETEEFKIVLSRILGIICLTLSIMYLIKIKYGRKN